MSAQPSEWIKRPSKLELGCFGGAVGSGGLLILE